MRIAVVSTPFIRVPPQGYGGTELFCATLVDRLVARGHDVTLFATGDSRAPCDVRALFRGPVWPPDDDVAEEHAAWAIGAIADGGFDAAQLNVAAALPFARELELPAVYTIHHAREEALTRLYERETDAWYVGISARQLELEGSLARACVIHHGLPLGEYPFSPRGQGWVAHVGRFAEQKGTHLAIDAARLAGAPIRLAGRCHPVDREYHEREIVPRLRLRHVEACGEAAHAQKLALIGGADALLCPIQWEEPFGLVAIEAMVCGTPVIGCPRGSFPEIVDEGVTGLLVDDLDAMARAIERARAMDRAACARRARARFSSERMADAYERLLLRAARRARPSRAAAEA